jgi:transposase InsO family protein
MKLHANAKTCPKSRRLLVERVQGGGWSLTQAAVAAGVSDRTAYRWLQRFRDHGELGLEDRSSAPKRIPHKTPAERVAAIAALRRLRMTAAEISEVLLIPISTVSAWLKRIGLGKRSRLEPPEPPEPPNRYEVARPGQLVHVDVKKLGRISARGAGHRVTGNKRSQFQVRKHASNRRITGYEFVHVMVDDHSRLAYAEVFQGKGENARQAVAFLGRGLAFFHAHGVKVERVMSDNGPGYISKAHAIACRALGVRHTRILPRRPRTNGKAERFIQTLLNEWAYVRVYGSSKERERQLNPFLKRYNFRRPHGSLGKKPPGSRLTNVVGNNS